MAAWATGDAGNVTEGRKKLNKNICECFSFFSKKYNSIVFKLKWEADENGALQSAAIIWGMIRSRMFSIKHQLTVCCPGNMIFLCGISRTKNE